VLHELGLAMVAKLIMELVPNGERDPDRFARR
jgi:hypothetical protein